MVLGWALFFSRSKDIKIAYMILHYYDNLLGNYIPLETKKNHILDMCRF